MRAWKWRRAREAGAKNTHTHTQKKTNLRLSPNSIKQTSRNIRSLFDRLIQQMARARSRQITLSRVSRRGEKKQVDGVKVPLPFMWKLWNVAADKTEGEARDRRTSCSCDTCVLVGGFLCVCGPFMRQSSRLREGKAAEELSWWPQDGVLTSNDNQRERTLNPISLAEATCCVLCRFYMLTMAALYYQVALQTENKEKRQTSEGVAKPDICTCSRTYTCQQE